ncbi:heavy metal-binding protein HIP-like [Mercenaria mercenaria]|uniref:heavy metal-binding protein HIP-like n=1 Tax=Mercenaria mercenaria TaxID=6596 RepID=UPI00234E96D0|nr:heavy metal-binding protein HIP-like [Mercenaria mercenaria]
MMDADRVILCVATILLLVAVWIAFPVGDSRQQLLSAVTKDIADLKLLLNEERNRRIALETNINNLNNDFAIQNEMVKNILRVNGKMQEITNRTNVAFYARLSKSYLDIAPWATIVFADVETNDGSAYNSANGEFTAPVAGTYVFYSHILSQVNKNVETALQINGNNKLYLYSGGGQYQGSGSNMAVVHLNVGDIVKMVKHGPWGIKPFYIHHAWSSFSGFLLRIDATVV